MKKLLLLSCLGLITLFSNAQYVNNGGFELWNDDNSFEYPESWMTSSLELLIDSIYDAENATRTTNPENQSDALRLEVIEHSDDTLFGWAMCSGNITGDDMEYTGGFPMTVSPDSLFVKYTCDVIAGDTALMFVSFKKDGAVIGEQFIGITGTKSTWEAAGFELNMLGDTPDTAFIALAAGKMDDALPGSVFAVDSIWFSGTTDIIPNNGFSTWADFGYEDPVGWISFNQLTYLTDSAVSVTRTEDSYRGNYAVRMESMYISFVDVVGAALGTGENLYDPDAQYFDLDFTPSTLTGYYKYEPAGDDTAGIYVQLREADQDMIMFTQVLHEATTYTAFELQLDVPDTFEVADALIGFTPSYMNIEGGEDGVIGSVLCIDAVDLINPCDAFTPPEITHSALPECEGQGDITLDAGSGWDSYLWSNDETTQTIDVTFNGTYSVTVTDTETGCEFTDDIDIFLGMCDATKDYLPNDIELRVYPNPSKGIFHISMNSGERVKIEVINIVGSKVCSDDYNDADNITIDLRSYPKGIYYMTVKTGEYENIQKLIVQ